MVAASGLWCPGVRNRPLASTGPGWFALIGLVECGIYERLEYGQRERLLYHASINEEGLIERLYVQSRGKESRQADDPPEDDGMPPRESSY